MNIYIVEHVLGSRVPFKVKAFSEEEALEKVFEHMGSIHYSIVGVIYGKSEIT